MQQASQPPLPPKASPKMPFEEMTKSFESHTKDLTYRYCSICKRAKLGMRMSKADTSICFQCFSRKKTVNDFRHPIWIDQSGTKQFHVPTELTDLSEGEKLLIQQVSPYVPLQHLQNGSYGAKGHVCSFPQNVHDVCTTLPRLPSNVNTVSVVRGFVTEEGESQKISFKIRKDKVLTALRWLQKYNTEYHNITIAEDNLSWMESDSAELPNKTSNAEVSDKSETDKHTAKEKEAYENQTDTDPSVYGYITAPDSQHLPQQKDDAITEPLAQSFKKSNKNTSIDFPYVSEIPVNEYDTTIKIFCKAFPWLYPGGVGDYNDYTETNEDIDTWMERLLFYFDGRFARDKMWCFFALNYSIRRKNTISGGYFVNDFYKDGKKTLTELQEEIKRGKLDWVNCIQYYSHKVKGSPGYWRFKRSEVYTWINHHISQKHGPPTLFITLSCAEYHWPDIKRLIIQRNNIAGRKVDVESKTNFIREINDFTLVVQEYFQKRVNLWLDTVGRFVFGIKHHWLRYEFAPGRGQIHAHMLAITDHLEVQREYYNLYDDNKKEESLKQQANYLSKWVEQTFHMPASVHPELLQRVKNKAKEDKVTHHPSSKYYSDLDDIDEDIAACQWYLQLHKCTEKCMQVRRHV